MRDRYHDTAFRFGPPTVHPVVLFDLTPLYHTYPWLVFRPDLVPWAIWWLPIPDSTE